MDEHVRRFSRRAFAGSALASALVACKGAHAARVLMPTPPQTSGPFYPAERLAEEDADLTWIKGHKSHALGRVIEVTGRVLDRHGNPVSGSRLELWQCNSLGRYAHPADPATTPLDPDFQGYAAIATDRKGEWRITTIKPAAYDSPVGRRTPHIHFRVHGKREPLTTQMYFSDDDAGNTRDALYRALGGNGGLAVARLAASDRYTWDIVLAGA